MFQSHILTIYLNNCPKFNPLYLIDINYGAYYRLQNLVNNNIALAAGFKPDILFSLMAHLYWNMS